MAEQSYWRRAVIISCCVHCLLFVWAGWIRGGIFNKAAEPETIEMELISSVVLPEQTAPVPITMPQAASLPDNLTVLDSARPMTDANTTTAAPTSDVVTERFTPAVQAGAQYSSDLADAVVPALARGGSAGVESATPVIKRISAPRILSKVEPNYPDDARQEGVNGMVGVKVEVLENGHAGEVRVIRSSGHDSLDEAALQAVRKWRFVPAEQAGQAVRCYATLTVDFLLN